MFIFDEKDKLLQAQFAPFPYMLTDDGDFFKYKVSPKIKKIMEIFYFLLTTNLYFPYKTLLNLNNHEL